MKKTVSIDLDGVLNKYDGHFNENEIPPIREGAKEFLSALAQNYKIEIFTTRNKKITFLWLQENHLLEFIYDITNVKNPFCSVFIDDRGINFCGDFDKTLSEIVNFKPFWKKVI